MTVHVVGWSGTTEPGGGREARAYVDGVCVTVRRAALDGTVTWRCAEHGESVDPTCHHMIRLACMPAPIERKNRQ